MKKLWIIILCLSTLLSCSKEKEKQANQDIITSDIDLFWEVYDSIKSTPDSVKQLKFLQDLFINKGTIGLKTIMQVRRYQPEEYVYAINNYPLYWNSVRQNTLRAGDYAGEIQVGVNSFKKLYPEYKPAKLYFEIGVFRTPGTALDSILLIGAEMAMANETVDTSELPESMNYVKDYVKSNPIEHISFLNVHEYVHSQQSTTGGYDLLSQSIFEGVAEFMAELATEEASPTPAISYGEQNDEKVKKKFMEEMFYPWFYEWIWNDKNNEFGTRDLGYYVGRAIAKRHYDNADDKARAIRELIELDYNNSQEIEQFADQTGYFNLPLTEIKESYELKRPQVVAISPFENGDQQVEPTLTELKIEFSSPMDSNFRSTGYGELGEEFFPTIETITFSADGKSVVYKLQLIPEKRYQFYINFGFRDTNGVPLKPYLIDFKTAQE